MLDFVDSVEGSGFFAAKDHLNALAVLVEPQRIEKDAPGKYGNRDIVTADITVFTDASQLDGTVDPLEMLGAKVTGKALVRDLESFMGKAVIARLEMIKTDKAPNPFPVLKNVDPAIKKKVVEYATKREEARKKAADDAPDFLV